MGKLKFTLSNIWLWLSLAGVTILTENLQFLTTGMKTGLNIAPMFIMCFVGIGSLFMFFFLNHKENKMKFDYFLLVAFILFGAMFLVAIWVQDSGSVAYLNGGGSNEYTITTFDKVKATLGLVMFLAFLYGMFFMFQRTQPHTKTALIPLYVGLAFVYTAVIFSLIKENKIYKAIFTDDPTVELKYVVSFFGNKNYYGGIIFVGLLISMLINYHRPRFIWYLSMVFLLVMLTATAAALPILIALVAVPLYFIEEIARYSFKRKWYIAISVTIALITLIALIVIFYLGTVFGWKGFQGIDRFITEAIADKDFKTLTGRTKIWAGIFKACFDNPMHMIFGRGFMVSQNQTVAITSSLFNTDHGVRTAHNGYLQVLYEFGIVGFLIHAFLICYFVYSLIRLMLEKRFHFVFVYGFAALCYGLYNVAESSPLFGYGIKELFMTCVLAIPVMARCKLLGRHQIVEEAMNLPQERGQLDFIKLGKAVSGIIMSIMVSIVPLFVVQFTYDNRYLLLILGLTEIVLFIALLIVPYLIAIWYKGSEPLHFLLHVVFNTALIAIVAFVCTVPFIIMKQTQLALYLAPLFLFIVMFADALVYSIIKGGTIFDWFKIFGVGAFVTPIAGSLSTIILGIVMYMVFQNMGAINWFVYLFGILVNFVIFYAFLYIIPVFKSREIIYEVNKVSLYHDKRCTIKDETTYG